MSKINDFIQSVFKTADESAGNLKTSDSTFRQLKSNTPLDNQQAIDALMMRLEDV